MVAKVAEVAEVAGEKTFSSSSVDSSKKSSPPSVLGSLEASMFKLTLK